MMRTEEHAQLERASTPFPFDQLSAPIAARIRSERIETCEAWRALGRRRFAIFGVVTLQVQTIDELVVAAMAKAARG